MTSVQHDPLLGTELMHEHVSADISDLTTTLDPRYLKLDQTTPQTTVGTFTFPSVIATNYLKTPKIYPSADSTTAIQILKADGTTSILNVDTTNARVGIGTSAPAAYLHLKAGTASASTAPIKLTAGTDLTVTEAGVVEYDGTNYHITNSGLLRRNIGTEQYVQSRGLNLVTNGSGLMDDNTNFTSFTFDKVETHGGGGSFLKNVSQSVYMSVESIPIDSTKTYKLIGWAKSGETGGTNFNAANRQYFGVAEYDIDGNSILPQHACKQPGSTDTTLAAQLNVGDTTVTLTDATGWYNSSTGWFRHFGWWPYTNAQGYTWANYTYTRNVTLTLDSGIGGAYGIYGSPTSASLGTIAWASADKSLTRSSGNFLYEGVVAGDTITSTNVSNPGPFTVLTVTATKLTFNEAVVDSSAATTLTYVGEGITGNVIKLRSPWAGAVLPVGTPVRNNPTGNSYKYIGASNVIVPNAWTNYTGYIGKAGGDGIERVNDFRAGTAFVKLIFLVNYHGAANNNIRWSDMDFSEVETVSKVYLSGATDNETAYTYEYVTNKSTSGDDTGFLINQTDTLSPGTSFLHRWQVGGTDKAWIKNTGDGYFAGNVGIGTTSPGGRAHINGTVDDQQLIVEAHSTQTNNIVEIHDSSSNVLVSFNGVGGAVINEQGSATGDFRVESDTEANMVYLDANGSTDGELYLGGTTNGVKILKGGSLSFIGTAGITDATNINFGTTTGSKIGNSATAKLALYDATPIVRQNHIVDADGTLADATTKINAILVALENLGVVKTA